MVPEGPNFVGSPVEIAGVTDRGLVRPSNEDSYLLLQGAEVSPSCSAVAAVFDGVGGLGNGEEASCRAARHMGELLMVRPSQHRPHQGPGKVLAELILGLHTRLRTDKQREPALLGMATTATIALLSKDRNLTYTVRLPMPAACCGYNIPWLAMRRAPPHC